MSDSAAVPPSRLLRVQGTSRLAFGATTAALVTLASGGTAVLVASSTHGVGSPTSLPAGSLPPDASPTSPGVVVDRPAGEQPVVAPPAGSHDETEHALRQALAQRPVPGRRTLTAPLVPVTPVTPPVELPQPVDSPTPGPTTPPTTTPEAADRPGLGLGRSHNGTTPKALHDNRSAGRGRHALPKPPGKGRHAR
jgi:hypothetical protein